ncbi:peptidoglycan editing factor PgeF [Pseudoduganella aquatica]|uniref:Purine nucleoside phosphorylase n=1 Tax=Pseudoduganella aquatica TaxID=2660641 RepID=A0A7X4HAW8_9BURK|nr:peptidoglycan editing factor PgeF [Pseudoduganella aquatica]MYN07881.1 peptidoglycan editing factor PgeF [Pseudoduganella aquatica]
MTAPRGSPQWLVPDWPGLPPNIGVLATTRRGGVSPAPYDDGQGGGGLNLGIHVGDQPHNVAQNRATLAAELPDEPVWLNQVHGVAVADADKVRPGQVPTADASIARVPNTVCAILTADCLPVLFCDTAGTVVGAAHAGWRGLADGVLQETTRAMREAGAGEIMAWLGVAIGPVRFEVGNDVLQAFLKQARASGDAAAEALVQAAIVPIEIKPGKYLADMYALARAILRRDGVLRVAGGEYCTVSNSGRFYSYRRDGVTGRQATLIWIK